NLSVTSVVRCSIQLSYGRVAGWPRRGSGEEGRTLVKAARRCKPCDGHATPPPGPGKMGPNPFCRLGKLPVLDLFRAFHEHGRLLSDRSGCTAMFATRLQAAFSIIALVGLVLGLAAPAFAQDLSAADRSAIRDVIQGQVEAFRRDDGEGAFGYASP